MHREPQKMDRGFHWAWAVALLAIVALAAIWWLAPGPGERAASSDSQRADAVQKARDRIVVIGETTPPHAVPPASSFDAPVGENPPESGDEQASLGWEVVDLEEVRKAMPDNLYWKRSVPTKDPKVQEERDAEHDRLNVEYGKILSGNANEEEIRSYFDYRAKLNGDSIEFTTYLLDHYREKLPERDVGLLELARRMHNARLEEIPRKLEEALERKHTQDAAREAWLADQAEFGAPNSDSE